MKHRLWYNTWTEEYMEGLPVGNGRLAAMMVGRPEKMRIALNHEWLWRGDHRFRSYFDRSARLPEVREALLKGDFLSGTTLANEGLGRPCCAEDKPHALDPYQPAGDVYIEVNAGEAADYRRSLDLDRGLAETRFVGPSGLVEARLFASFADGCIVAKATSEQAADMAVVLTRAEDPRCTLSYEKTCDQLTMKGRFTEGLSFETAVKIHTDGTYRIEDARILVENATSLTVFIQIGTDAKGNPPAAEITWPDTWDFAALFERHEKNFAALRGDAVLDVAVEDGDDLPTDERIRRFREGNEPSMPLLYFEYGRYLMVSGSSGELPLNLQGKWNEDLLPPWSSDYHLDINLQMCYWFVETLGMKQAANTLFALIERYAPSGRAIAKNLYGCNGISFSLAADVWSCIMAVHTGWSVWVGAAPWVGQHMYMHYRYTKDLDFLRERCYPFLKECAAFYEDYLIPQGEELWVVPSQSPENRFEGTGDWPVSLGVNSAMDVELITELLLSAMDCATILDVDADKIAQWQNILSRLPKLSTDSIGRLNEWDKERVEVEPEHRHLSHLYGAYPSQLFQPDSWEWNAAQRSLDERLRYGGGHTGWSRSWVACLMARFGRGEEAWHHFMELIGEFATVSLLDLHPPRIFQIDGNMGGTACVCEMLMQSRKGVLHLLPALPKAWPKGRVENFYAQDGVKAAFSWDEGKLRSFSLTASEDQVLTVKSGTQEWVISLQKDVPYAVSI